MRLLRSTFLLYALICAVLPSVALASLSAPDLATTVGAPPDPKTLPAGERWIDIDVTKQTVSAKVGDRTVYTAPATTGKPGYETPEGTFRILYRVYDETMDSMTEGVPNDAPEGYRHEHVYFTQYFAEGGYALHTNYWQPKDVFGNRASSHGCVGLHQEDAEFFWHFAKNGTKVVVHK